MRTCEVTDETRKLSTSLSSTLMVAVPLVALEALAVMTAFCVPSRRVSLMMLSVKLAEVAPAAIVTVEVAGVASLVSVEDSVTVVAAACAAEMVTVPETLLADSAAEAGKVTESVGALSVKLPDVPVAAPLVAVSVVVPEPMTDTFPVHEALENAPVFAGDTVLLTPATVAVRAEVLPLIAEAG